MNQAELKAASEALIREILRKHLQADVPVYLFGSRARNTARWNSDYDLWIDANLPSAVVAGIQEELDESFVPFKVDIVTTPKLRGRFGEIVKSEAKPWM
ncbi:nucleotidyltransferase family protein [Azonexus sp.]|jgi:predicted nucleotidyltransferase|uniref:nucleotidyltransferase family protein n=1 Tax=Azonexus sp. TaxID=1872668 RepID=UPI0035AFE247